MAVLAQKWIILDVEYIQTDDHKCRRKIACVDKFKRTLCMEFFPCKIFGELSAKDRRTYFWNKKHTHHLPYEPVRGGGHMCEDANEIIREFVDYTESEIILFKGGVIEKEIGKEIGVQTYDLERLGVKKAKNHNPLEEVQDYYNQLGIMYTW